MEHQYILTVDVGTSSTKTVLWDEIGQLVAEAAFAYSLHRPEPLWAEIDGETWWEAVCTTIHRVIVQSAIAPSDVVGIGVDGVGWTMLPVDQHANPLSPAMIWLDRRAVKETEWLKTLPLAGQLVDLSANPIDAAYITPKLLWLKAYYPSIFDAAYRFMTCSGFITARLTGEFTCDYTQAYGYHFFDLAYERWDEQAAAHIGIPLEKMPRLCPPTEIIGALTAQAAAQTGLASGIPVIAGCLDAASGALGAGVTQLGKTNEQGGQAGGMAVSLDKVVIEPQLIFSHHVIPGQYLIQAGTVGGGTLGWFRDVLGQIETNAAGLLGKSPFELISQQVQQTPPGAHGLIFLPYMAGERTPLWSNNARGTFIGLSYSTTRGDLLRAMMEGCAFAVYDNLLIAAQRGVKVREYWGSGGATQSAVWCQIKADVSNIPFIVGHRVDGGEGGHSLGLYALTARAVGLCNDIGDCVEHLLPNRQVFEPSSNHHAMYEDLFGLYRSVSRKLLEDFDYLASLSQKHGIINKANVS